MSATLFGDEKHPPPDDADCSSGISNEKSSKAEASPDSWSCSVRSSSPIDFSDSACSVGSLDDNSPGSLSPPFSLSTLENPFIPSFTQLSSHDGNNNTFSCFLPTFEASNSLNDFNLTANSNITTTATTLPDHVSPSVFFPQKYPLIPQSDSSFESQLSGSNTEGSSNQFLGAQDFTSVEPQIALPYFFLCPQPVIHNSCPSDVASINNLSQTNSQQPCAVFTPNLFPISCVPNQQFFPSFNSCSLFPSASFLPDCSTYIPQLDPNPSSNPTAESIKVATNCNFTQNSLNGSDTSFLTPVAALAKSYIDSCSRRRTIHKTSPNSTPEYVQPESNSRSKRPANQTDDNCHSSTDENHTDTQSVRNFDEERERKKIERRSKNKISAYESRKRAKAHVESLENTVRKLIEENERLGKQVRTIMDENTSLRQHMFQVSPTIGQQFGINPSGLLSGIQCGPSLASYKAAFGWLLLLLMFFVGGLFYDPGTANQLMLASGANRQDAIALSYSTELSQRVVLPQIEGRTPPPPGNGLIYWVPRLLLDDGSHLEVTRHAVKRLVSDPPDDIIFPYSTLLSHHHHHSDDDAEFGMEPGDDLDDGDIENKRIEGPLPYGAPGTAMACTENGYCMQSPAQRPAMLE